VIFISYATPDFREAEGLCNYLDKAGLSTWMAPLDIPRGRSQADTFPDAVSRCDALVFLFSGATNDSAYVPLEIDRAVAERKLVVPVRLENATPSPNLMYLLGPHQWIDAFKMATDTWRADVVSAVKQDPSTTEAKRSRWARDIAVSPTLFFVSALVLLGTLPMALIASGQTSSACGLNNPLACLVDPRVLAILFFVAAGLAVIIPRFFSGARRYIVLERRDAAMLGVTALILVLAAASRSWLAAATALVWFVLYYTVARKWLGGPAVAIAAAALIAISATATYFEASVYRWLLGGTGNVLVLFDNWKSEVAFENRHALKAYQIIYDSTAFSFGEVRVTPEEPPSESDFGKFRRTNPETELEPLFQQALFRLRPFDLVLVTRGDYVSRCGKEWLVMSVKAMGYSHRPTWGPQIPPEWTPHGWSDFRLTIPFIQEGSSQDVDPAQTIFAAHVLDWLSNRADSIDNEKLLEPSLTRVIARIGQQFPDYRCQGNTGSNGETPCADTKGTFAEKRATLMRILNDIKKRMSPDSDSYPDSSPIAQPHCPEDEERNRNIADDLTLQLGRES
jgi:hypothetical protein